MRKKLTSTRMRALVLALLACMVVQVGCGGGLPLSRSAPTNDPLDTERASTPPPSEEVQHATLVFDGEKWFDNKGAPVSDPVAYLRQTAAAHGAHVAPAYLYIWQARWGWHWFYWAFDTGHPFGKFANKQPHLNFCRYYNRSDMIADMREHTSKRAQYDGHFTIYRNGASTCAYYFVSKDQSGGPTGTLLDSCIRDRTVAIVAAAAATVVAAAWLAPYIVPQVALLVAAA
jgi:hypothetical protein